MSNPIKRHAFTATIEAILVKRFGSIGNELLALSPLLAYLNEKTKSASRGSKSRGSFANHYALYVLVEDYIAGGFSSGGKKLGKYSSYDGARFTDLLRRQRELPFGGKLQNHGLNGRLNDEFKKYFPVLDMLPIVRDVAKQRYWIQEDLLKIEYRGKNGKKQTINLAPAIIEIIDAYATAKREAFEGFIESCRQFAAATGGDAASAIDFVRSQLKPEIDARVFEIVSFAVLKSFYAETLIFWGWTREEIREDHLSLFKTGRTNANDGGIDFVMRPLGRFFQVTETVDANKYFLDIDKIQRFPLTFVVKSVDDERTILESIKEQARSKYGIDAVVNSYMRSIEEIINIARLLECLDEVVAMNRLADVMNEIEVQSKIEFNYEAMVEGVGQ